MKEPPLEPSSSSRPWTLRRQAPIRRLGSLCRSPILALLAATAAVSRAPAQTLPNLDQGWRWVDFGAESGLPPGGVTELVEVDSVIWVASRGGVAWYDGFIWSPATSEGRPLPPPITSLAAHPAGGVLVVAGGRIFRGGAEGFRAVGVPRGDSVVRALPVAADTLLYTARTEGVSAWILTDGSAQRVEGLPPLGDPAAAWRTGSGRIWIDTREGMASLGEGGWTVRDPLPPALRLGGIVAQGPGGEGYLYRSGADERSVLVFQGDGPPVPVPGEGTNVPLSADVSPEGVIVAAYETGDVRARLPGGSWVSVTLPQGKRAGIRFVRFTGSRNLWVGTHSSLHLYRADLGRWLVRRRPFPAASNRINTILVDRDTTYWLGTGDGIFRHRVRGQGSDWYRAPAGVSPAVVTGLAQAGDGSVWATSGAEFEGALRFHGGTWTRMDAAQGLDVGYAHRVQAAPDGTLWFSSLGKGGGGEGGLFRWRDGVLTEALTQVGIRRQRVYGTAWGPDGTHWVALADGLLGIRDGAAAVQVFEEDDPNGWATAWDVAVAPDGRPWVAFNPFLGRGLAYLSDADTLVGVVPPGPESVRRVWSLLFDESGALWVGTEGGVLRFQDGVWALLDEAVGLSTVNVWPLALHPMSLLIGTKGGGLVALDRSELSNPAPRVVVRATDVDEGTARIDYEPLAYWGQQPHGRIESRHRLDDGSWSPWSTEHAAVLTGLGPGTHRVHIQAKGLFGQLSDPVLATVVVPLPLWLRPVFVVPLAVLMGALLWHRAAAARRAGADQRALALSEGRLRTLVESAPEAIGILDVEAGRFVDANENALRLLDLRREDLPGLDPLSLVPEGLPGMEDARAAFMDRVLAALSGRPQGLEWTVVSRSGEFIPCELHLVRLPSSGTPLLRVSVLDIRERKAAERRRAELEEQLHQSQKLEAVGQLTGGVAHDFNNLLTVIRGNLELLREGATLEGDDAELVDGALQAAERSARLTQRLLAFSRRQQLAPQRLAPRGLVDELYDLLDRTLGEAVDVVIDIPEGCWQVHVDRGQLENAILNLAVNARDAMPRGGVIRIAAENVPGEALDAGLLADLPPRDHLRLWVADTGAGMSPAVLARAIEPFFTTKEVGRGTGLGLSMVYGFVTQSGGTVRLESAEGVGTTVSLYLPRHEGA